MAAEPYSSRSSTSRGRLQALIEPSPSILDHARAWNNRAAALSKLEREVEALASYGRALAIEPNSASILFDRGVLLTRLFGRHDEALVDYERVLEVEPEHPYALNGAADAALMVCDWTRSVQYAQVMKEKAVTGKSIISPLSLARYTDDTSLQFACAKHYLSDKISTEPTPLYDGTPRRREKKRIAYLSADFNQHAVSCLITELFERHDRKRFETFRHFVRARRR